jgi:hypothetical protein
MDNKLKNRKTLKRGSRRQVWNGSAEKTMGGLGKDDLMKNERGRIVSKKKCTTMKNSYKGSDDEEEPPAKKEEQPKKGGGFWDTLF